MRKNDEQLKREVELELHWEPRVNATQIGVTVDGGAVSLYGTVDTYAQKWAAEKATRRVHDVRAFAEELIVKPLTPHERTDSEVTAAIQSMFDWNASVPASIVAKVEQGWVSLEGAVTHHYQREEAARVVGHLRGVLGVSNGIRLVPEGPDAPSADNVRASLRRRMGKAAAAIEVEMDGGRVMLRGQAPSLRAIRDARSAAWAAAGVSDVLEQIQLPTR